MILHTVSKSPFQHTALDECLRLAKNEDAILLIEDGVYAATAGSPHAALLDERENVYALEADIKARGLQGKISSTVTPVSDAGFVELVASTRSTLSWY
jgi:tRNA 2-thiouridine synthesizing protein B